MSDWYEEVGAWIKACKSPEEVQKLLANWVETAAHNQRNTDYYRGLLEECGKAIGVRAFTCDDASISEDVLCAKIPEIIKEDYNE